MHTIRSIVVLIAGMVLVLVADGCGSGSPRFTGRDATSAVGSPYAGQQLEGIASYYADDFAGKATANGEIYNMHGLTAAHRTLPFNSRVRVTNQENGKSVVVRINDRGPFKGNRVIDLSLEAARTIGLIAHGTAPVTIEVLQMGTP